jgi:DNA gyrase subunit A
MADDKNQPNLPGLPGGGDGQPPENIVDVSVKEEMTRSYVDYAMSVIIGRAIPDVRDGLKPVHRRIMYTMLELGLRPNRPHRKCAKIVGDTSGNYHPHGPLAIYDALVRLGQDFNMRYPLVDKQGNFGSIDGDPPAAERYTEARLARIAEMLLEDIESETVDFRPNYDETREEPEYLPTRVPNLLINGSAGIAVGMATNIPPHNLSEIVNATIALIEKPDTPLEKIIEMVPGPDFPTGAFIYGRAGIQEAYRTGRGKFIMRAKVGIEEVGKEKVQIVVTEIPYQVIKKRLEAHIAELVNDKKIEGISDLRDESDRDGMRLCIELKRGEQPEVVLNNLYKHTQLQTSFDMILLAIVNGQPRVLGLIEALKLFIDHREEVVRKRTEFDLRKAREREHILEGFQKALDNLDAIIKLIRASKGPADARGELIRRFAFTERQAIAILELQLQRLTGMERDKILQELKEIKERIEGYLEILGSEKKLKAVVVKELREIAKEFGDERRTQFKDERSDLTIEDLVADEDMAVTVTQQGYLKRTPIDTYRSQTRGGKGRIGMTTRDQDFVKNLFIASAHSYILVFTTNGRCYWLKVYDLPDVGTAGRGKNIQNLVNLQPGEKVTAFLNVGKTFEENKFVVLTTKLGVIKKSALTEFDNPRSSGIIAIGIEKGDELIGASVTDGKQHIFLGTHEGMSILFSEEDVRAMGRQAYGVNAMDLDSGDYLIGMETVNLIEGQEDQAGLILTVSEKGYGKRTPVSEYRRQSRAGKGVINMKATDKTGKVVAVLNVRETTEIVVITQQGKIIRVESNTVRETGRSAQGVRLLSPDEGDRIAAATIIPEDEEVSPPPLIQ